MYKRQAKGEPSVDVQDMHLVERLKIQEQEATIYIQENEQEQEYMLLWTSSDYVVQIRGSVTQEEIVKIAENISF